MHSFPSFIAERYLKTRRKGAFVRTMVRFAQGGVALGVFVLVLTTALMNGFSEEIQAKLWSATSHFLVAPLWGDNLSDTQGVLAKVRSVPGVVGATPMRQDWALARANAPGAPYAPLLVLGVDPASVLSTTSMLETLKPLRISELQEGDIVMGDEAASHLGVRLGGEVALIFAQDGLSLAGATPRTMVFRLVGLYHCGSSEYDRNWACISLADSMAVAEATEAGFIGVRVGNINQIDRMKPKILAALGQKDGPGPFTIPDLRDQNRTLFAALKVQKWVFSAILSLIILVATFNIVSSLVLFITEKRRDLGVLLSLGATPAQVQRVFELQGVRIAAVGTAWGLALGIPTCLVADHFHLVRLPAAAYDFISYVPFRLSLFDLVVIMVIPVLVAWMASRFPARRAASVDPVEALRAE